MRKLAFGNKLERMNLDAKLRLYTTVLIIVITVVMLSISTIFTVYSLYQNSEEAAESKLSFVASSYGKWLENNKNILLALQQAPELQAFCNCTSLTDSRYKSSRLAVLDNIENLLTADLDINFISVYNSAMDTYVYRGNCSITNTGYDLAYNEGMKESQPAKEKGSTRIYFGNRFFRGAKYSVTFYQPIYSVNILKKQIGMLCMNVNDSFLKNMEYQGMQETTQMYLADREGQLIGTQQEIGEVNSRTIRIWHNRKGCFTEQKNFYFYQKIGDWNYFVINVVPRAELYKSSVKTAVILIGSMSILLAGSIFMIRKLVHKSYGQVSCIVDGLEHIARNDLDYRIETSAMGADFEKLANGFNHMTDEINKLMVTIREEQFQLDQIRLQALQSQIQPHFLYNTLECIHWQSCAEGNKQVSKLVMALASYYRLSLSKGKDIVTLKDEIAHIKYYVFIQNQRFGELISTNIFVSEELEKIAVPKLTLQPLVENAIYHGIGIKENNTGTITITAVQKENEAVILIRDSGGRLDKEQIDRMNESLLEDKEQFGYGVRNVHKRIQLLFGKTYGLAYTLNEENGATVEIRLPAHYQNIALPFDGGR